MMQWLERITRTQTKVINASDAERESARGRASAMRLAGAVQLGMQMLLWVCFGGYDRAAHTVWQPAVLLLVPLGLNAWVWRRAKPGRRIPLALLPCLLGDAVLLMYGYTGLVDFLIPEYPFAVGALAVTAACWLAVMLGRPDGVIYGLSAIRYALVLFFLLGTVLLNASRRADRLWPLMGEGIVPALKTAALGAGSVWGGALLFLLPKEQKRGRLLPVFLPWAFGAVWALWFGFLRPWSPQDALSAGERLMGLARHASGVVSYQLAALLWLAGGPAALCGGAMSGEWILRTAFPRCPRAIAVSVLLIPAMLVVLFGASHVPRWLNLLLPWRWAVSIGAGLCACREGRK